MYVTEMYCMCVFLLENVCGIMYVGNLHTVLHFHNNPTYICLRTFACATLVSTGTLTAVVILS